MDSVITEGGAPPKLLQFTAWLEVGY